MRHGNAPWINKTDLTEKCNNLTRVAKYLSTIAYVNRQ